MTVGSKSTLALQRWLNDTVAVDDKGEPQVYYHGTQAEIAEFDPSKTVDGGLHFGTAEQANMRRPSAGKNLIPVYLAVKKPRRSRDSGGKWKSKIASAKAAGYDGIVYLNRYEGMTTERVEALSSSGMLAKLDRLSDAEFRKLVPEARDSYIVFSASQVRSVFDPSFFPDLASEPPQKSPTNVCSRPKPRI